MRILRPYYDNREVYRLIWPDFVYWRPCEYGETTVFKVMPVKRHMKTADYYLKGHKRSCLIERKASVSELATNLFGTVRRRRNFLSCLDRMVDESDHPYLFLDMRWSDLWKDHDTHGRVISRCPFSLYDHLMQELFSRGIGVIGPQAARTINTRRQAGDWLLRVMLNHAFPRRSLGVPAVKKGAAPISDAAWPTTDDDKTGKVGNLGNPPLAPRKKFQLRRNSGNSKNSH